MRLITLLLVLLTSACASYRPMPLPDQLTTREPDQAIINQRLDSLPPVFVKPDVISLNDPLNGDAIAALAVINNPDLKAMRAKAGVSQAQVFAAGLLPDPVFSAGIDHILSGPDPVDNLSASLGIDLKAISRRSLAQQQAREAARQVRMDVAWAEWQTAGEARLAATHLAWLGQVAAYADRLLDLQRAQVARMSSAADRGDISMDRLAAAQTALGNTEDTARQSAQAAADARHALHRLLGLPPDYPIEVAQQEISLPPAMTEDDLLGTAIHSRADLAALRAGYAAQEAQVHKAVLDQFPSLDLTINGARDTGRNKLLGPSVSFTLPLWNRNRGGIAVARATRKVLQEEYRARLENTRADIAAAIDNLSRTAMQLEDLTQSLPDIEASARASNAAAARGDISMANAAAAEENLLQHRMLEARIKMQRNEQAIALELLTGVPRQQWKSP